MQTLILINENKYSEDHQDTKKAARNFSVPRQAEIPGILRG